MKKTNCYSLQQENKRLKELVEKQNDCIAQYQRDEDETSDKFEKLAVENLDLKERLAFCEGLLAEKRDDAMIALSYKAMQKQRDELYQRLEKANRKIYRLCVGKGHDYINNYGGAE